MKRYLAMAVLIVIAALLLPHLEIRSGPETAQAKIIDEVENGPVTVWSNYPGEVASRQVVTIMSSLLSGSTIVELAEEGKRVREDDVLVRFDAADLEQKVIKLEREFTLAQTELESLTHAKIPMELDELSATLMETEGKLGYERAYLKDSRELLDENLVSPQEVEKQRGKVARLKADRKALETRLSLTREYLHPLAIRHANATVSAARQELEIARRELKNSTIRAPVDGVLVFKPLHVGNEFRSVRIGDKLYPNQPFMVLPDMASLVVHCQVPESELSRVTESGAALIRPVAYGDLALNGHVEKVSTTARTVPGKPQWQRYFHLTVGVDDRDARLRPGMSVAVHIRSFDKPNVVRVRRRAVYWDGDKAYVEVEQGARFQRRDVKLGVASDEYYEIVSGVEAGKKVRVR